ARAIIRIPEVADMSSQETGSLPDTLRESDAAAKEIGIENLAPSSGSASVNAVGSSKNSSPPQSISPGKVNPSTCSCGCASGGALQQVFALGRLGYDFGSEARRDSIQQQMD